MAGFVDDHNWLSRGSLRCKAREGERWAQIHQRAYELYEARGTKDGHEVEDWLRAEEEIPEKKARTIAA